MCFVVIVFFFMKDFMLITALFRLLSLMTFMKSNDNIRIAGNDPDLPKNDNVVFVDGGFSSVQTVSGDSHTTNEKKTYHIRHTKPNWYEFVLFLCSCVYFCKETGI